MNVHLWLRCSGLHEVCYLNTVADRHITKTFLYKFAPPPPPPPPATHPLTKSHFYIVNWGLQGYTLFFLFLLKAVLTCTHNLCFVQKYEKYQNFLSENFHFLLIKFSVYLNRRVLVMRFHISRSLNWNVDMKKQTLLLIMWPYSYLLAKGETWIV